jgi:hypothetical protein
MRDALLEKVEYLEEKFRVDEARALAEKEKRKEERNKGKRIQKMGEKSAPSPEVEKEPEINPLEKHYEEQAKKILNYLDRSPLERRIAIAEAVSAIKKVAPLTHPPEPVILSEIEKHVILMQQRRLSEPPPPKPVWEQEDLEIPVDRIIDPAHIKSHGEI